MEFFEASEEGTLYVRERRSRRQIRADVDDVPPVDAHDHRWSGRLDEPCDIADVDDRAVPGADRDRGDRGERVLGRLRVRYEHVFEPVRSGELRRQVAAVPMLVSSARARSRSKTTSSCGASPAPDVVTSIAPGVAARAAATAAAYLSGWPSRLETTSSIGCAFPPAMSVAGTATTVASGAMRCAAAWRYAAQYAVECER